MHQNGCFMFAAPKKKANLQRTSNTEGFTWNTSAQRLRTSDLFHFILQERQKIRWCVCQTFLCHGKYIFKWAEIRLYWLLWGTTTLPPHGHLLPLENIYCAQKYKDAAEFMLQEQDGWDNGREKERKGLRPELHKLTWTDGMEGLMAGGRVREARRNKRDSKREKQIGEWNNRGV